MTSQYRCIHSGLCRFSKDEDGDCFGNDYDIPCPFYSGFNPQAAPDLSHITPERRGCLTCLAPDCPVWQAADQNCWKPQAEREEWQRASLQDGEKFIRQSEREIPNILFCQSLSNEHGFCGKNDCFCKELERVESGDICKWMQENRKREGKDGE